MEQLCIDEDLKAFIEKRASRAIMKNLSLETMVQQAYIFGMQDAIDAMTAKQKEHP